ncbi:NADH-ubiquinone oxidoreductase-F iron-sulfur binding region domain-containing protein [Pseudosulfitobacter sp. DSM 107133]|uniref:NADH-ubiquinone oxidoreductase-F iron-sulfur binding region domain-containing protein n=1 Tax=Pseudosulfitobacter sp. DSM 107133 TaxID=2883100 RepID=UPI000DF1A744|nr:NADH-ubiquinone oxidoreductase-F iron-sulfur binding region domain-containing protein [Pseudosulfitobacter sp. DSM 107133]UOA27839.1 NADP-reducing hydrogenase subunit HndC [Pseudosulfitobacter sp. DSM 107133]
MKIYVPMDSAAKALGAEDVVAALRAAAPDAQIVRTGTRGMIWLEPLVEVEIDGVRHGYGPAEPEDVAAILDGSSAKALGPVDDLDWMKRQTRLTFARVGVIDPLSLADYQAHGGLAGLRRALDMSGQQIVDEIKTSGLRGRGGAGFPTGIKWQTVHDADAAQKYIVCNADEGDSGTFADRMIMEGDPFTLIEGMAIAGLGVGATRGYVYLRSEYPDAIKVMRRAVDIAREQNVLGSDVLGSGQGFDMEIRVGAGAYVCGEETSLLNSLEGRRGVVRAKPPLPALEGFLGRPTVVNNVISLATVPVIFERGAQSYADFGMGRSRGTVTLQIAGNVARGGLFETAFGISLGDVVNDLGGGTASGRPVKAVQIGGPLGAYLPVSKFAAPMGYEELDANGGLLGHAGLTVFDDTADMLGMARFAMEFCAVESCGKCTPCRIGAVRGVETIDRIAQGDADALPLLSDLCETMQDGSLCALGGLTPLPVMSAVTHFPAEFSRSKEAAE